MTTIKFRNYQEQAFESTMRHWRNGGQKPLIAMATGLGKSYLGLALGLAVGGYEDEGVPGRVAYLAHTRELTDQPYYDLPVLAPALRGRYYGRAPAAGIVRAQRNQSKARFMFATMQTLAGAKGRRLDEVLEYGAFDLVILDEAHHAAAVSYANIIVPKFLDANPDTKFLGLTATPARSDGKALDGVFDAITYQMNILDGIRGGWLKALNAETVKTEIDISSVARRDDGSDFVLKQLSAVLTKQNWTEIVGKAYLERGGRDRYAISFMPSVLAGRELCEWLRSQGVKAASVDHGMVIDGEGRVTEEGNGAYWKARDYVLDAYKGGDYRVLGGYSVLLEGFDAPNTDMILQGRPTESSVLLTQLIGRGLRTPDGVARIMQDKERGTFMVQRDGDEKWYEYPKSSMPFAHDCHVLDFTLKNTEVLLAGSLTGIRVETPDIEDLEEDETLKIFASEDVDNDYDHLRKKGEGQKYFTRNYFSMSSDNFHYWPDGTYSAYLGAVGDGSVRQGNALFIYPPQKEMTTRMRTVRDILSHFSDQGRYPAEQMAQLEDVVQTYYRAFKSFLLFTVTDVPVNVGERGGYASEFVRWNSAKAKVTPLGKYATKDAVWEAALPISQELSVGGFFADKNRPGANNAATTKAKDLLFNPTYSNGTTPNIFHTMPDGVNKVLDGIPGLELFRIEKPIRNSLRGEKSVRVSGMLHHIGIYSLVMAHGLGQQLVNAQTLYNTWSDVWRIASQ